MLRTFFAERPLTTGRVVSVWNGMPNRKQKEAYRIVKLVHYSTADGVGEYQVEPVRVSKDPGNLRNADGTPSKDLR